ncbi:hypothetical protein [Bifidobacterium aquikefiricola]|uniref:Uncharacterized protein n=1 Tax=Bifidobacterium aquikefiricola TaxID=3059038 RepID=A0AB39U7W2_9BIFI
MSEKTGLLMSMQRRNESIARFKARLNKKTETKNPEILQICESDRFVLSSDQERDPGSIRASICGLPST